MFLCWVGLHHWSRWMDCKPYNNKRGRAAQQRECTRCGLRQVRSLVVLTED